MSEPVRNKRLKRNSNADETEAESPRPPVARGSSTRPSATSSPGFRARLERIGVVFKAVLGVVAVVGATAGVAWGAKRYATSSPRFAIKTVLVEGNNRLSPEEIANAGGVHLGDNVFAIDLETAQKNVEASPWVKSASVTRKLPGSISVRVVEHEPAALVALGDALFLVSKGGEIFKQVTPEDPLDFPVVTGLTPESVGDDRQGAEKRVVRALDVIEQASARPELARYPVQEARLLSDGSLDLVVGRDAIVISLGHPPYRGKLEQAERVLREVQSRKAQPAVVFMDNESSPERVVVRMR